MATWVTVHTYHHYRSLLIPLSIMVLPLAFGILFTFLLIELAHSKLKRYAFRRSSENYAYSNENDYFSCKCKWWTHRSDNSKSLQLWCRGGGSKHGKISIILFIYLIKDFHIVCLDFHLVFVNTVRHDVFRVCQLWHALIRCLLNNLLELT